jgi:hypothetical protein
MGQILITGATGNIGTEVIRFIKTRGTDHQIIAGGRNLAKAIFLSVQGAEKSKIIPHNKIERLIEIELTGNENLNFNSTADILSAELNDNIEFVNVNPFKFFRIKKQDGLNSGLIIVLTMLHFLPRLQSAPTISNNFETLTGYKPTTLKEFVHRERFNFLRTQPCAPIFRKE